MHTRLPEEATPNVVKTLYNNEIENFMAPGIMKPVSMHLIHLKYREDIINLWLFH